MRRRVTKDEFIRRARQRHADKYDYTLVEIKNVLHPVRIVCPQHGEFEQVAYSHMLGRGCPQCARERPKTRQRLTTENFVERARQIHGERYDYSKTQVTGPRDPVLIICPVHGPFEQRPVNHLIGFGCNACFRERLRIPIDQVEAEVREAYPHDELDRDSFTIKSKPVIWRCTVHGQHFRRAAYDLLENYPTGCRDWARAARAKERRRTLEPEASLPPSSSDGDERRIRAYRMHLQGYSLREISRELGISAETVRLWIKAIRRRTSTKD
jgi:hypothetical protein